MTLEALSISKEIKNILVAPIPSSLIQQREGGGKKMLSYLSGNTVIDMLNSTFGYMWNWEITSEWSKDSIPSVNKYVNGTFSKDSTKWTLDAQGPVAHVKGVLTVFLKSGETILTIKKEGYGSKSILGKQNDQESIFKAAGTDALKKAASLLGIGLELYRNEDEQAYFDQINYDDPWTEEMLLKHAVDLANLDKYTNTYKVSDEELAETTFAATGDTYSIYPENIETVMAYIKSLFNKEKEK